VREAVNAAPPASPSSPPPVPARRSGLRSLLPLLGLLVLGFILSRQDWSALSGAFARLGARPIAEAALLFFANTALKSVRFQRMLLAQRLLLPLPVAVASYFASLFYGQVTLGRVGELYKTEALLERGVPLGTALSSSLYDRLLDLALVTLLAAVLGAAVVGDTRAAIAAGVVVLLLIAFGVAVLRARALATVGPIAKLRAWLDGRRGGRGLLSMLAQVVTGLDPLLRPSFLMPALLWTAIAWAGYFGSLWRLADGMGIHASLVALTAAAALGALSALLPVTISGLGAREAIYIQVLGLQGVSSEHAFALSIAHLGLMTAVVIVTGSLGLLVRARQQRRPA
jgi:uncharacterized protein (TIRG00374 family)